LEISECPPSRGDLSSFIKSRPRHRFLRVHNRLLPSTHPSTRKACHTLAASSSVLTLLNIMAQAATNTPNSSSADRPERSRNAKAQARHRAKRKAYIEQVHTHTHSITLLNVFVLTVHFFFFFWFTLHAASVHTIYIHICPVRAHSLSRQ
jgi:hypothetical protein